MQAKRRLQPALVALYAAFVLGSLAVGFEPGKEIGRHFVEFFATMLTVLPCAFVLIGLFEVWVDRARIERHLGQGTGLMGHFWAILLAGATVGGLVVALPVAHALHQKGARLAVVFTYLGAAAICRVPMTVFEASFLGVKFSLVRWCVSLPLVVASSVLFAAYLEKRGYRMQEQ